MTILLVTDSYPPDKISGVGQVVRSLHREYKRQNYTSKVLTTGNFKKAKDNIISYSHNFYLGNLINTFVLVKIILSNEYNVIHLHHSICTLCLPLYRVFKLLRITNTLIVNTLHVDYLSEFHYVRSEKTKEQTIRPSTTEYIKKYFFYPLHIIIDLVGFYFADQITALSEQNKKDIQKNYGFINNRNIIVVPNGFDQQNFNYNTKNFNSNELTFVYTGSFRTRKNITRIIDILSELNKKTTISIKLSIIGEGSAYFKSKITKHIQLCNFESNVEFKGKKANEHISNIYSTSEFFIITSTYEGFPVSILEAIGSGLVVVTDNHYGAKDMLNSETAILLSKTDLNENINKLLLLIQDSEKLKTIQQKAYEQLRQKYMISHIATRYIELYKSMK